ncbi:MAG TPA: LemA family protein [Flavobacterium sp.]|jgi:LemA protein
MSTSNIVLIVGVLLVIIFANFLIGIFNKIINLKNNYEKAFGNIDVILMQRAEEIPNLVKVTQRFLEHETTILTDLTKLRTDYLNAGSIDEKINNSVDFSKAIKSLFAVSENYPVLSSNNNFIELQKRVSILEDKIADRREFFNDSINLYNIGIQIFPNFILAKLLGYSNKSLFPVSDNQKSYDGIQF